MILLHFLQILDFLSYLCIIFAEDKLHLSKILIII